MDTNKKLREHISAFKDGELPDADLELALAALHGSDGQRAWDLYHRIGDALRETAVPAMSLDFGARLAGRLDAEPLPAGRPAERVEPGGLEAILVKSASS
jgi:sigma-E factor negative regulatory protein RseA